MNIPLNFTTLIPPATSATSLWIHEMSPEDEGDEETYVRNSLGEFFLKTDGRRWGWTRVVRAEA